MVRSGGWWSLKVVAVVLVAAGVAVEGDGDVNGGVGGWCRDVATGVMETMGDDGDMVVLVGGDDEVVGVAMVVFVVG
ncbi:hypothetical protein Tco_1573408, partial [Tanacetum coccineum]